MSSWLQSGTLVISREADQCLVERESLANHGLRLLASERNSVGIQSIGTRLPFHLQKLCVCALYALSQVVLETRKTVIAIFSSMTATPSVLGNISSYNVRSFIHSSIYSFISCRPFCLRVSSSYVSKNFTHLRLSLKADNPPRLMAVILSVNLMSFPSK